MEPAEFNKVVEITDQFEGCDRILEAKRHGSGHINDTYLVVVQSDGEETTRKVIIQRINTKVFTRPLELMENIEGVTGHLRRKIQSLGGDPNRESLTLIPCKDGKTYHIASDGGYWRCYLFVDDTDCYDLVDSPETFYESGVSFGTFQSLLADFPAEKLHESIPNFHNTKKRYEAFVKAVEEDVKDRAKTCEEEIRFYLDRKATADFFVDLIEKNEIPIRVTHNDTKLNNILFDKKTRKGLCIVDLDTIMPGLTAYDFGDSIRFGASTGVEDEKDLSKISCSMDLYRIYTKGFLEKCKDQLTKTEIDTLPMGAMVMTYECGMRFLTDYLQGDVYFKIARPEHNLDRARTQMKLVADMEAKWEEMQTILRECL